MGVRKPASGKLAVRYRQKATAVDEAAQTIPTVSPFDPAVRDSADFSAALQALPAPVNGPGFPLVPLM